MANPNPEPGPLLDPETDDEPPYFPMADPDAPTQPEDHESEGDQQPEAE